MSKTVRNGRFEYVGKNSPQNITNDDLKCADCRFRAKEITASCAKFPTVKPNKVLLGEDCTEYKKGGAK